MTETNVTVNSTYKARIFEMVFSDRKELLALYNAVNGTCYTDPEKLEINTLKNAIYMSMHNDISFLIDSRLSLYEHQSTYSPNLPLRYLFYVSDLYSGMTMKANLYGKKQVFLPAPRFLIFYNGAKERPEKQELKLSTSYSVVEDAVEAAISECIREEILSDFLMANKTEAKKMSIYEYDEELHMRQTREEGREEGWEDGFSQGETSGKLTERIETILDFLKDLGTIPEELHQRIMNQKDLSALKQWVKLAAKVDSIEDFQNQI